jgi:DNA-binding NtrC family response regulator
MNESSSGSCVLLAEDDEELRSLLALALRKDGHGVIEAQDGSELLEKIASSFVDEGGLQGIDVVVSDIRMPGWTGMNVLFGLRNAGCDVPVVLITAFGEQKTHDAAARLGAACVLDKPFDIDDLRQTVSRVLADEYRAPGAASAATPGTKEK